MLPADQAAKLSAKAKAHEAQVVKIQALARGHISRVKLGCVGKKKVAGKGGRRKDSDKGVSDLEKKIDELQKAVAMFSKPKVLLQM